MMTTESGITLRSATTADAEQIALLAAVSFTWPAEPAYRERSARLFPLQDAIVAVDGDRVVGCTKSRTMTLTVPGERTVEATGIAGVTVSPMYRRRGILRAMYEEQHRRTEAAGLPLTIFTASQGGIYGRFGYGPTIRENRITVDRRFAEFRPGTPDPGGVESVPVATAIEPIKALYDRLRRFTPGMQARPDASWEIRFGDPEGWRGGGTELFALLHPDGYVLYRYHHRDSGTDVEVVELRTVTAEAHIALWRALFGLELVVGIEAVLAEHDPLPYLLTDLRLVRTQARYDALWLRCMDVPAALTARSYRTDLDVVLAVRDPFREAGGTFALRVRDGAADCAPTTRTPDIELGIDVLGSLYLGAYPARVFAAAQRLQTKDPARIQALEHAFATDHDAELGWHF
ncbi:GNAT family N-acetyltransferase [Nocardia sp. NPDC127579]|uniref:GNAT family N-acetyltransferase n=1 Tax=Nocardia sp. NPDC127579 TaxID=3345402 RepID=UPI003632B79C